MFETSTKSDFLLNLTTDIGKKLAIPFSNVSYFISEKSVDGEDGTKIYLKSGSHFCVTDTYDEILESILLEGA